MSRPRQKKYTPTQTEREAIDIVEKAINECKRWHEPFARKVEKRYDAWRGMSAQEAPRGWRSNVQQPLLINIVEGMLASMEDGQPTWDVLGRVVPGMSIEEAFEQSDRTELSAALLRDQMRRDEFAIKQGPFILQDLIAGFTPGKVSWLRQQAKRRYLDRQPEMIYDESGATIDIAMVLDEYEDDILLRDDPTFQPRDIRDFMYPESATSVETAPYLIDRTFVHWKTCVKLEGLGVYENTEFLRDFARPDTTRQGGGIVQEREQKLRSVDRTRGLVEIVEYWTDEEVITVANRSILLRRAPNPHWHGLKPFVTCSAIPDAFQIPGVSIIEGLAQMQEMVWTLQNLRLDSTRMAANMIKVIRGDVENSDEYEWAPNADWFVRDVNDVKLLDVPTEVLRATLESEGLLKGDIQGIMGGLPTTGGGAMSQTFDQKTATGISIVTNIAQSILLRRKQQYQRVFGKLGGMFLAMDQQLLRKTRAIEILGEGGARRWVEVSPTDIQGIFDVEVRWTDESMLRQERRAESASLLTNAVQFAMPSAQMGVKLNLRKFWERHLTAFGVTNPAEYFLDPTEDAAAAAPAGAASPPGAETLMDAMSGMQGPGGITNPELAAGPTSPSNTDTIAAMGMQQQFLAGNGNGRSA